MIIENVSLQHFCQKMWALKRWCLTKVAHCSESFVKYFGCEMQEKEMILYGKCQQENPNSQTHCPVGNSAILVSSWKNRTSGCDFPVPNEHRWWILFVLFGYRSKYTVKPVLRGHSKIDKTKVLMTNDSLMQVESITDCSLWSILQCFWPA